MLSRSVLDWVVTPFLALLTAAILILGGCQSDHGEESAHGEAVSAAESGESASPMGGQGEMPDPETPKGGNLERPEGWMVRLDTPNPDAVIGSAETADVFFVNMTPGWHITTQERAIFYHPAAYADGDYTASAGLYFFDPGDRQREGYGIIFGGSNLDSDNQSYGYFLLRNTGDFLIKKRSGDETSVVQDWTPSDAVNVVEAGSGESVLNELSVRVEDGQVHFLVNGENVATHPVSAIPTDGLFGLRLNHGVNVHVATFNVEQ
jgi:hypothetical protein